MILDEEKHGSVKDTSVADVDFNLMLKAVWHGKSYIFFTSFLFIAASVVYVLNIADIYKSDMTVAPAEQQKGLNLSGQLGGLASLAGVNLGDSNNLDKTTLSLEILMSRDFIVNFVKNRNILLEIMAVKGWDLNTNKFIYDDEIYDISTDSWIREVNNLRKAEPSPQEIQKAFISNFEVTKDSKSGVIKLSFKHYSPFFSKQVLDWVLIDINRTMKSIDIDEARKSIAYLENEISKTNKSEVKSSFFSLIEEQTKTLMLANVRDEYMFKVIDPPIVPDEKNGPKRFLIVALSAFFGVFFGVFFVLIFSSLRRVK